jgi:hypothetical protein
MLEAELDEHLGYKNTNTHIAEIVAMAVNPRLYVVNMVKYQYQYLKIGIVNLNQR